MTEPQSPFRLVLTKEVLAAFNAAKGASLTEEQLRGFAGGRQFSSALIGCIVSLGYTSDEKLFFTAIDGPLGESYIYGDDVSNLNDFRKVLQEAANFGHQVMIVVSPESLISSVNLRPCQCPCKQTGVPELPSFDPVSEAKLSG